MSEHAEKRTRRQRGRTSPRAPTHHPRSDPFKHWPNSDLLAAEADQDFLRHHHGVTAILFDWPDIRELFDTYNDAAEMARTRSRRAGVRAVYAGFLSLVVAACSPVIAILLTSDDRVATRILAVLGFLAAALALVSVVLGLTQVLRGRNKAHWLGNRFCAERVRQFHFQLILNNLPHCVQAVSSQANMASWLRFRKDELDRFEHEFMQFAGEKFQELMRDDNEDRTWVMEAWFKPSPTPPPSPALTQILKVLREQRLGIQKRYAATKLKPGWHSPSSRHRWTTRAADSLTLLLLLITVFGGASAVYAISGADVELQRSCAVALDGLIAAGIIALRVLDEGLQLGVETERYRWYLAALESLDARFTHADTARRIMLLREMEQLSYQELTRFAVSAGGSRFIM